MLQIRRIHSIKTKSIYLVSMILLLPAVLPAQTDWSQLPGPNAGRIFTMVLNGQGDLLAGTDEGGIFRYNAVRGEWEYLDLTLNAIQSLYKRSDGILFAGTSYDLYSSSNNGNNWTKLPLPSSMGLKAIAAKTGEYLFVGGWDGIARSSDDGQSWVSINSGLPSNDINTITVDSSGRVWTGLYRNGLHRSTDNGNSWSSADPVFTYADVSDILISRNGHFFVAMDGDALARSMNGGATWEFITSGFEDYRLEGIIESKDGSFYSFSRRGKIYKSTDNGSTWRKLFTEPNGIEFLSMMETSDGTLFAGTNWSGIYRSTDAGVTWTAVNKGLTNNNIASICIASNGDLFVVSETFERVQYSSDRGKSWEGRTNGMYVGIRKLFIDETERLFGTTYYGLVYSTDKGHSWIVDSAGMYDNNLSTFFTTQGGTMFAGTFAGNIYRATGLNQTWTRTRQGVGSEITSIVATADGSIYASERGEGLARSTDDGISWMPIPNPTGFTNYSALLADGNDLYAGGFGTLHKTSDGGGHWEAVGTNFTDEWVNALLFLDDHTLLAGIAYRGVHVLPADSNVWHPLNTGLFNSYILSLAASPNGDLYAGTFGNGLFTTIWKATDVEYLPADLTGPWLHPNYPNPVSGRTEIGFTLSPMERAAGGNSISVHLAIHDLLGREIAELYDGELPPGGYSVPWAPGNLPNGIYICMLVAGNSTVARSIVVAR